MAKTIEDALLLDGTVQFGGAPGQPVLARWKRGEDSSVVGFVRAADEKAILERLAAAPEATGVVFTNAIPVTRAVVEAIAARRNLSIVAIASLSAAVAPDQVATLLSGAASLEVVSLVGLEKLSDTGVEALAKLPRLRALTVGVALQGRSDAFPVTIATDLTAKGFAAAAARDLEALGFRCAVLDDAGIAPVAKSKRLRFLELAGADLTAKGLDALSGIVTLEELRLPGCEGITDLSRLRGLTAMRVLDATLLAKLTDAGLRAISGMTGLESLLLGGCSKLSDAGLDALQPLKSLRHLDLGSASRWLAAKQKTVAAPKIAGKGLAKVPPSVVTLRLRESPVTDLSAVASMPNLETLDISEAKKLPAEAGEHLLAAPKLRRVIAWKTAIPKSAAKKAAKRGMDIAL